jgi:hypothetical protein
MKNFKFGLVLKPQIKKASQTKKDFEIEFKLV